MLINHSITNWSILLGFLKIDPAKMDVKALQIIQKWCQLNIKSNFNGNTLKDMKDIFSAYLTLNTNTNLGKVINSEYGYTVAHQAAKLGFDRFLGNCLNQFDEQSEAIKQSILVAKSNNGNTPLHLSALFGQIDTVEVLLEHHADANVFNNTNKLPIHLAAVKNGHDSKERCIRVLLTETSAEHIMQKDDTGMSLFLSLVELGDDIKLVDDVLTKNPKVLFLTDAQGQNPSHCAIIHNRHALIDYFARNESLLTQRTGNQSTCLHLACRYSDEQVIRKLLESKFFIDCLESRDDSGQSALNYLDLRPELKNLSEELEALKQEGSIRNTY